MLQLITEPENEPLLIEDAKLHLRVEHEEDDPLISGLITTAREMAEKHTRRAFRTVTYDYYLDEFPWCQGTIRLPYPPLQSVTYIKYIDDQEALTTLPITEYKVDTYSIPARVVPTYGVVWPYTHEVPNAVVIRYVTGHEELPKSVKQWMLIQIAAMYEMRSGMRPANIERAPRPYVDGLLDSYVVYA